MANKKISELPYIIGGKISGNTLVPLVTYFSATTGDTVHTYVSDFKTYIISGLTGNTDVFVTGGTYSAGTITFKNNTGGTFNVTGLTTGSTSIIGGEYLPLSGGTVTGNTIFTSGLTSNVISATTYQNLPISGLTAGNNINISGSNGNFTISVTGNSLDLQAVTDNGATTTNGMQIIGGLLQVVNNGVLNRIAEISSQYITIENISNSTSATLKDDGTLQLKSGTETSQLKNTNVTNSNVILEFPNKTAGSYTIATTSDLTSGYVPYTGATTNVNLGSNGLSASTISAATYQNLPTDIRVTGGTYSAGTSTFTNNTGGTFSVSGFVTGDTYVTGLTFNTTNYNLTIGRNDGVSFTDNLSILASDLTVTGGTYNPNNGAATFTNNTGGTFTVTGFLTGFTDIYVTGGTYSNGTATFRNTSGGTFNVSGFYTGQTSYVNSLTTGTGLSANTTNGNITIINTSPDQTVTLNNGSNINVTGTYPNFTIGVTGITDNDRYVSGFTYNNNTFTISDNSGSTYNATFNTVTGLTVNGNLIVSGNSGINWFSSNTSSDLVRITQTGTGNAFVVEDNTNPDSSPFVIDSSGNTGLGITVPDSKLHISNTNSADTNSISLKVIGTGTSEQFLIYRDGRTTINTTTSGVSFNIVNSTQLRTFVNSLGFQFLDASGYGFHHTTNFGGLNAGNTNGYLYLWSQASDTLRLFLGGQDRNPTVARTRTVINPVQSSSTLFTPTGGTAIDYSFQNAGQTVFSPTGGTASYTQIELRPSYNATGTYSGTVRGLYYNPILTSLSGTTHISIQTTTGDVLFGTTSGNVGIGTTTPRQRLDVSGNAIISSGMTASTISATTYQNLPTDVNVTGGTYSAGTITFTNNTGGTFNVTGLTTGSTSSVSGGYLPLSGGTVTGQTFFASGVTISGDTNIIDPYGNMSVDTTSRLLYNSGGINTINWESGLLYDYNTTLTSVDFTNRTLNDSGGNLVVDWVNLELTDSTNVSINWSSRVLSDTNAGPSVGWDNRKLYKSGGTISFDWENGILTGQTNILSSTISATTYQNLPVTADTFTTAFTYSNNVFTISRNQGQPNLTATINTVTGLTVNGNLTITGTTSTNTISATTYQNLPDNVTGRFLPLSGGTVTGNTIFTSGLTANTLNVTGNTNVRSFTGTTGYISGSGQNILTVIGSGNSTTSPLFSVQGSSGELFSVSDSLTGSLFSVNDISGLPIVEVFSDNTTLWGSYQAPSLNTTTRTSLTAGTNTIYSIPTSAYTGAFYEYTLISTGSTGARAGQIMSIWSGSTAQFTETKTSDIGTTTGVTFTVAVSGNNAVLSSSATTAGWTVKTIIRSI